MDKHRESALTLEILEAVASRSDVTQRHLADRLGVALGLANSYMKRCARKGFIKITQAPANRYLYYLTPHGLAEKTRLTAEYLTSSFEFYHRASDSIAESFRFCAEQHMRRVLLAGVSELAEIGSVRAHDFEISLVGTFDPDSLLKKFIGKPVWQQLRDIDACEAVVLTALLPSSDLNQQLVSHFGADRVVVPGIVRPVAATEAPAGGEE